MTVRSRLTAQYELWTGCVEKCGLSTGPPRPVPEIHSSPDLLHTRGQLLHQVVHRAVLADQARDLGGGMDDGRVVAAAEFLADLRERRVGQLPREVHRHLARVDDVLG